jgi:hypothetical protein
MADEAAQSKPEEQAAESESIQQLEGSAPLVDVDATAQRLTEIANESLDSSEVARQIEELTSVVLDSAEVSTRSASIAADVSSTMRAVVTKIQETNRRNIMHSRVVLGIVAICLLMAMGVFFAITVKMSSSVKELDTIVYTLAKRVIEVDASLTAIDKTKSDLKEVTERQDKLSEQQDKLSEQITDLGKNMSALPTSVAEQTSKLADSKQSVQKELQALDTKLQALDSKITNAPALKNVQQGPNTQTLLTEILKLRQDLDNFNRARDAAQVASDKTAAKNLEQALLKAQAAATSAEKAAERATTAEKSANASEKSVQAERLAEQKAAAERAAAMRQGLYEDKGDRNRASSSLTQADIQKRSAEKPAPKSDNKPLVDKVAADKAAADKAEKLAADKAAADKAAAQKSAADKAAADKAAEKANQQRAAAQREKENSMVRFPRNDASE